MEKHFNNLAIFKTSSGGDELFCSHNQRGQQLSSFEEAAEMLDFFLLSEPTLSLEIKAVR